MLTALLFMARDTVTSVPSTVSEPMGQSLRAPLYRFSQFRLAVSQSARASERRNQCQTTPAPLSEERIAYLEGLVSQARTAAAVFSQYTQEDVDRIVKPMVIAGLKQAQYLARLAVEETRIGVLEDKALKNMVATEFVYNYVKDKRTVGVIREYPERGIIELAEPIGVIFSLTPITNPTSTVLFKCIMAIKTRNAVIFSPHPSAWRCCSEAVKDHVREPR